MASLFDIVRSVWIKMYQTSAGQMAAPAHPTVFQGCCYRAASALRRNTLFEPYATKVPCYSLSYLWIKSLLSLHCTNNFFLVFLLKKYNFFIPFLHTHSIPQLSFQAQRKWTKMRSESDHNFNSWHIFGRTVLPVPFSSTTTTTSQKQTFTRIQTLI